MHPNICRSHDADSIAQTIVATEIPHGGTQCGPQQGYRRTHRNEAPPPKSKIQQAVGKIHTKELGQLAQGVPGTKGTVAIMFIKYDEIPLNHQRHITYGKNVDTYRPEKEDPNWTRLTVGGNRIVYPGDVFTPTVEIMTVKMHLNSVISTKSAKYCTFNIKDVYLNTLMAQPKFMRIKLSELATTRIFQPVQPQQHHCQ